MRFLFKGEEILDRDDFTLHYRPTLVTRKLLPGGRSYEAVIDTLGGFKVLLVHFSDVGNIVAHLRSVKSQFLVVIGVISRQPVPEF